MTFLGLLLIIAAIYAVFAVIEAYRGYNFAKALRLHKSTVKKSFGEIFLCAFIPFIIAVIIWLLSFVVIAIVDGDRPVYTCTRNVATQEEQSVIFKEQTDDEYIVTADGKEYYCSNIVITDEVQNLQVVSVNYDWASKTAHFFWCEMSPLPEDAYELYIPVDYLNSPSQ